LCLEEVPSDFAPPARPALFSLCVHEEAIRRRARCLA
jgi:hypothetical protein